LLDVDVDGVEALDRRQGIVLAGLDERSNGVERPPNASRDGRADDRAPKIDLGRPQGGGLSLDIGARLARRGQGVIVQLPRDEAALHQLGIAAHLTLGCNGRGAGAGERGAGVGDASFVADRIDAVERLSGADVIAFGEQPRADDPVDLRPNVGGFIGRGAARKLGAERNRPFGDDHHSDGCGAGLRLRRRRVAAAEKQPAGEQEQHASQ
jgi:hypothetical protein